MQVASRSGLTQGVWVSVTHAERGLVVAYAEAEGQPVGRLLRTRSLDQLLEDAAGWAAGVVVPGSVTIASGGQDRNAA